MIKTCLLVTDDPDDHQVFTEAIAKVAENTIVLIVVNSSKALTLLMSLTHIPDQLIIDLSMEDLEVSAFLDSVRSNPLLGKVPILTYGSPTEYADIDDRSSLIFFAKEYEYSQLQTILSQFLHNKLP